MKFVTIILFMVLWTQARALICPGGQYECDEGTTCCKLTDSHYGCCPFPDAYCCSNGEYCCPKSFTCDNGLKMCINGEEHTPDFYLCSNKRTACPKDHLCCSLTEAKYTCCPHQDYICCATGCCANTFQNISVKQNLSKKEQVKGNSSVFVTSLAEIKAKASPNKDIICPDGHSTCSVGATCCKLPNDEWGCCPLPNAICCKDRVHCCPSGMKCDLETGGCKAGITSLPFFHFQVRKVALDAKFVLCPDKQSYCPTNYTCCKLDSGQWGCCAYHNAVCCQDHQHCCPSGTVCDVIGGRCRSRIGAIPMIRKQKAKYLRHK